ncbi:mitochondral 37S ribosomal protein S27 [Savitreella phatthalungensis]
MPHTPALALRQRALKQLSARVFGETWNPEALRNGNKILRRRLRGPALLDYYPAQHVKLTEVNKLFPELKLVDQEEEQRLSDVDALKRRGKGAPKKGEGRRAAKGKRK